jgi:hypothetical protein
MVQAAEWLKPLKIYWTRGVGYICLSLLMFFLYHETGGLLMLFFAILIFLDGLCYVLAHFSGESDSWAVVSGYDELERGEAPHTPVAKSGAHAAGAAHPSVTVQGAKMVYVEEEAAIATPEDFQKFRLGRSITAQAKQKPP